MATQAQASLVGQVSLDLVSQVTLALEYRVILAQELVVGLDSQDLVCQATRGKMVVSGLADFQGTQGQMVVLGLADSQVIRAVMVVLGHQVLVDSLGHPLQEHLDFLAGLASLVMVLL